MEVSPVDVALGLPSGRPRTDGVHLSRIIRARAVERGILDGAIAGDLGLVEVGGQGENWWENLDTVSRLRISIGLAWEQWYIPQQLDDVTDHPGELQVDGIYMTHDGESLDTILTPMGERPVLALHEVKATYKSINTVGDLRGPLSLKTNWMWLAQMKGYCKGLDTYMAYLHVLFLCGDYSYPIRPVLKCWRFVFTPEEIQEEWDQMTGYVRLNRILEQV